MQNKFFIIAIILLALIFRLYKFPSIPPSLNWDEVSHGYTAYSLLKTGKDQWGSPWPIFNFRAYGDFPTTLNMYLTIPFVALFGLNATSARMPSLLCGIISVLLAYKIAESLFNKKTAIFTGLILATSQWFYFSSRGVFQSQIAQTMLLLGLYYFLISLKKPKFQILAMIFFGLSQYAYHNTRIAVPILITYLYFVVRKKVQISKTALVIFMIFTAPSLINLTQPESTARSAWVSILNNDAVLTINESRRTFSGPEFANKLINNKITFLGTNIIKNYLKSFDPQHLFFTGSENYQLNTPSTGFLPSLLLPLFYLGLITSIFKFTQHQSIRQCLVTIIITLIPAVITKGDYPVLRMSLASPFYAMIIAYAIRNISKKILLVLAILLITQNILIFKKYQSAYLQNYAYTWQYGYEEMVNKLKMYYPKYNKVYITKKYGEPHEYILFYWPWDPQKYQNDNRKSTDYHASWYWVNSFDKFEFINDWVMQKIEPSPGSLIVTSDNNSPPGKLRLIDKVVGPSNDLIFSFFDYEK